MKVTFVTDTYAPHPNGVANTLESLVDGLRELGNIADIIRPAALGCEEPGLEVPSFFLPNYPEIRIGLPIRRRLRKRWQKDRPDVVYVATESPLGASAISAALALGIPVASGFHTNFQQYMSHYQMPLLERAATSYLRHFHNRSTATFAPTPEVVDQLRELGFRNLKLLPKGVDTDVFSPTKRDPILRSNWGAGDSTVVGIFVGRLAAEKNLPLALRAFSEIRKQIPDFIGVFVGSGPKFEEIKEQNPSFLFTGLLRGENLVRHYASSDLFVFPSLTETFGNVTLEAMASGLVVVAFDYAAAKQQIRDGENGFTVRFGDPDRFIEKAIEIARRPDLDSIRKNARACANKAGWEEIILRFQQDLMRMIEENRSNPLTRVSSET